MRERPSKMIDKPNNCVAIVLAGGEARRMGGIDKGLVPYQNKPLIQHVLSRLSQQVERILISANRNIGDYEALGHAVVPDLSDTVFQGPMFQGPMFQGPMFQGPMFQGPMFQGPMFQGPMAGVVACLRTLLAINTLPPDTLPPDAPVDEWQTVLLCSCDVPYLPLDLSKRLEQALDPESGKFIAVAHDGQRGQALHCMIHRAVCRDLIQAFLDGERSLYRWQNNNNAVYVDYSESAELFLNINSLSALVDGELVDGELVDR